MATEKIRKAVMSIFDARKVECPVCHAPVGVQCPQGPNHVDRGRLSRYSVMGLPTRTEADEEDV